MKEILRKARAKVNLRLKLEGRRPDGFHLLSMLNATISLADEVVINRKHSPGVDFFLAGVRKSDAPESSDNSCVRAANFFLESIGCKEGVSILLVKNIPAQAGLGGGSSDAAATLSGLRDLLDADVDLLPLAKKLGSDVPFFLDGGLQYVSGIGDELHQLPFNALEGNPIRIIVPTEKISTAAAYAALRENGLLMEKDVRGRTLSDQGSISYAEIVSAIENDFSSVAIGLAPTLEPILSVTDEGIVTGLTGSGSCCFSLPRKDSKHFVWPILTSSIYSSIDCVFA